MAAMTSSDAALELPSVWIQELTWEEVASYLRTRDTIIVPFGTTEQHGPAGSLGLDAYVAIGLAEDAAKRQASWPPRRCGTVIPVIISGSQERFR